MMLCNLRHNLASLALLLAALALPARTASAQYRMDALPPGSGQDVSQPQIVEKPNALLPLDTPYTRSDGATILLASLFHHDKPVILSLVYFSCPNLCGFTQDALVQAVQEGPRNLSLGKDYAIVVVSIDADDTPKQAAIKQAHYVDLMNRKPGDPSVTYLTGTESNVKALADAVGFGYRRNFSGDKYLHATGIFICTPDGHLSQTILGLTYHPDTLHHALVEASQGHIGSGMLSIALCCGEMHFNPNSGKYEHNPYFWVGTTTGVLTILTLGGFLMYLGKHGSNTTLPPPSPPTQD